MCQQQSRWKSTRSVVRRPPPDFAPKRTGRNVARLGSLRVWHNAYLEVILCRCLSRCCWSIFWGRMIATSCFLNCFVWRCAHHSERMQAGLLNKLSSLHEYVASDIASELRARASFSKQELQHLLAHVELSRKALLCVSHHLIKHCALDTLLEAARSADHEKSAAYAEHFVQVLTYLAALQKLCLICCWYRLLVLYFHVLAVLRLVKAQRSATFMDYQAISKGEKGTLGQKKKDFQRRVLVYCLNQTPGQLAKETGTKHCFGDHSRSARGKTLNLQR